MQGLFLHGFIISLGVSWAYCVSFLKLAAILKTVMHSLSHFGDLDLDFKISVLFVCFKTLCIYVLKVQCVFM